MPRQITGIVSSDKTNKTIVVSVHARKTHPLYRKQYTVTKKFMAHDEKNEAQVGDTVSIIESKPISARKRFVLSKIEQRAAIRQRDSVETLTKDETQSDAQEKSK